MTTRLYTRRRLHDQRRHDPLYLLALIATLVFAITTSPAAARLFTFTIFIPILCGFAAHNEVKLVLAWRVEYWKSPYRHYPGLLAWRVLLLVTLPNVAAPAFLIGAMTHRFEPRALWTYAVFALVLTLTYSAFAVAFTAFGRSGLIAFAVYVLGFENLLCHFLAWPRWFSIREWATSATELLPTGHLLPPTVLPGVVGIALLLVFGTLGLLWSGGNILYARWLKNGGTADDFPGSLT
ncbi:hypothetical protein [Phytomonospora endophytica]|uniref:Uncharacterized protein n=1 Tax=Phytomonospora endophytica TaxID=714109 RepID=A0A841FI62_9ACTN|nr:hypothetical protein [Phytomonospora endophytica]MBB6037031.1 hypothetical protein [Phytomonospora endophytica]GIG69425.1 hypothetical protein Pen01_57200 [Phytomonospora endophytica]